MKTSGTSWRGVAWLVVLGALALAGCDTWKEADSQAGLAIVPGASRVTEGGRELIRIRGRRSVMLVDPRGGRVVDFHRAAPPRVFFIDDPDRAGPGEGRDHATPVPVDVRVWPNVLGENGWQVEIAPENVRDPEKRDGLMWQSDASPARLVLLSDAADGLRVKCEYRLEQDGDAVVTVTLINETGADRRIDVRSFAAVSSHAAQKLRIESQGQTDTSHDEREKTSPERSETLVRTASSPPWNKLTISRKADGVSFGWSTQLVPAHGTLAWTERWAIVHEPATATTRPATAPAGK